MLACIITGYSLVNYMLTSKSRFAVDQEFMYIGLAGPGRADRRAGDRDILNDSTTMFIDIHKTYQKTPCFLCRFASDGSASTDRYSSNEKRVQQTKCFC